MPVQRAAPEPGPLSARAQRVGTGAIARELSWVAIGHVVSQIAWFGSLIVLASLVPPRSFGTFTASIVVVGIAMLLMESGTRGTIVVTRRLTLAQIRTSVAINAATGIALASVLAAAAAPLLGEIVADGDADVLRVLSASIVLTALSIVPLAVLQREIRFKRHSGAISAAALGAAVVAIASALLGAGVWALVVRQILYGALVSALAWWNVRDLLPRADAGRAPTTLRDHRRGASAFFVLAAANLVALNADYVIVGNATDGRQLGLYSLAFMLGFAPLTNFSWKIGAVLFPALSATEDRSMVVSRTLRALRLMSLALLPLVVPAVVLAPSLLPAVLGSDWEAMVLPFQILIVAGVGHALINVFGEALSGTGNIRLHAALQVLMGVAVTAVMLVLVHADGIRGAAIAHLIVLVLIAAGYVVVGGRRLGIDGRAAAAAIAPVAVPVAAQAVATVLAVGVLTAAGVAEAAGALAGTLIGCAVAALVFRFSPWNAWHETSALIRVALHRADP